MTIHQYPTEFAVQCDVENCLSEIAGNTEHDARENAALLGYLVHEGKHMCELCQERQTIDALAERTMQEHHERAVAQAAHGDAGEAHDPGPELVDETGIGTLHPGVVDCGAVDISDACEAEDCRTCGARDAEEITAADGQEAVERLGIDVPSWATEIREQVAETSEEPETDPVALAFAPLSAQEKAMKIGQFRGRRKPPEPVEHPASKFGNTVPELTATPAQAQEQLKRARRNLDPAVRFAAPDLVAAQNAISAMDALIAEEQLKG